MARNGKLDWKAEILLSSQHGPNRAQEMIDHRSVVAEDKMHLLDMVKVELESMSNGYVPNPGVKSRSANPLMSLHFSILITRKG